MEQGNPNKVSFIVEEIVKNNDIFKLKPLIEQDREKESMEKSINLALSVLNEIGKELVLQDLSVDPDEKFKGFIDSGGNIDISGITKFTATIVQTKIEEAERNGIDLRKEALNVFKNKETVVEGILTVAVIDTMIKNYDNLSNNDIQTLIENYSNMPTEYQDAFNKAQADNLKRVAEKVKNSDVKSALNQQAKNTENMRVNNEKAKNEFSKKPNVQFLIDILGNTVSLINKLKNINSTDEILKLEEELQSLIHIDDIEQLTNLLSSKNPKELIIIFERLQAINDKALHQANEFQKDFVRLWEDGKINDVQRNDKMLIVANASIQATINQENMKSNPENVKKQNEDAQQKIKKESESREIRNPILQEIQQFTIALVEANFSQEEVKEAFQIYSEFIHEIDDEVIEDFKSKDETELSGFIEEYFRDFKEQVSSNGFKVLEQLAKNNFGGYIQEIFTNSKILQEAFLPMLETEIGKLNQQLTDTEVEQGIQQGILQESELIVDTDKARIVPETQEVEPENYSFINAKYLEQDSIEGLIPRNGGNSKAIQDDKTAIFYSQGKEGAIVMYFEFLRQYNNLRGDRGDEALQKYEAYQNGTIQLTEEQIAQLEAQIEQINEIRDSQSFDEFMGDKLYLKLNGLDREEDKKKADEWRTANPGTKMNYNYANSWTEDIIPPDRIDVVTLQSNDGLDTKISQKDIITYFLSQTSIEKIAELGINNTTLNLIQEYYEEHRLEIDTLGTEYSLVTQNIKEFEQTRESRVQEGFETIQGTEVNRTGNQEEFTEKPKSQGVQDFFKLAKTSGITVKEVNEQRTALGEQIKGQDVGQELDDEDKQQ